jgi:hypothetical protein
MRDPRILQAMMIGDSPQASVRQTSDPTFTDIANHFEEKREWLMAP